MTRSMVQLDTAAEDFRHLMTSWATGVAVVTSAKDAEPAGCTVNALTSVSLKPPLLLISLAEDSRTLAAILQGGRFGLNVLSSPGGDLAARFSTGSNRERFAGTAYAWVLGVPLLDDTVTSAVCVIDRHIRVADHILVLAEPVWWRHRADRRPAICFRRSYWTVST